MDTERPAARVGPDPHGTFRATYCLIGIPHGRDLARCSVEHRKTREALGVIVRREVKRAPKTHGHHLARKPYVIDNLWFPLVDDQRIGEGHKSATDAGLELLALVRRRQR